MSSIEESEADSDHSLSQEEADEIEDEEMNFEEANSHARDNYLELYANEPLADEEWLQNYQKEQTQKLELEDELKRRVENRVQVSNW